jgi:uncharacterized protein (DUF1501 family)
LTFTRREFVKGGLAGASLAFFSTRLKADMLADAEDAGRTLVVVQLIGGNDTLNTFIPYTDARYRAARPAIGIPDAEILHVDSRLGLHPAMHELHELYQRGKFAFVTNVGFQTPDRSHFYCQDVWQTGNEAPLPEEPGWIGRWADIYTTGTNYSPATNIGVAVSTPRGLVAKRVLATCLLDIESFRARGNAGVPSEDELLVRSLRQVYGLKKTNSVMETIRQQGEKAFEAIDLFHALPPASVVVDYPVDEEGAASSLTRALRMAAQFIAGGNGTKVIWVTLAGFDTHGSQVKPDNVTSGTHARLLRDLSSSLSAFQRDIDARGLADRVMVMAWSEFGRRVSQNASYGTDHGKAGSVMLLGNSVRGGQWYGDSYDLADLDEGDLKPHIDFRSIYATIIRDWLGGDPRLVLQKDYEQLGFLEPKPRRRRLSR